MKQIWKRICVLLVFACLLMTTACQQKLSQEAPATVSYVLEKVTATFLDESMDVTRQVMEIAGGMAEPMSFDVQFESGPSGVTYLVRQMNGSEIHEVASSKDTKFSFMADELKPEWPVYLTIVDKNNKPLLSRALSLRIHKSLMAERMPDTMGSEFGSGFKVDMGDFLSGMHLDVLPFAIPITVKTYADGAVRVGFGINSSDAKFWAKAANGEMPEQDLANDLKALYNKDYAQTDDKGSASGLGLIVLFSGWAEGNLDTNDPIKGHMDLYIGSGVDITGQYALFTWEVILTGGADGEFDFSYVFNEEDSEYHFNSDHILLGVKWGMEVYGGVGCKLASVGAYGAASLRYQEEMYPDPEAEHLILAGELGLKAKLFGKVIASFTIISGKHDFLEKDKQTFTLDTTLTARDLREFLYSNDYADTAPPPEDTSTDTRWFGSDVSEPQTANTWVDVRDFSHLLASDIYSDNQVQIANIGSKALPMMDIIFLGNDAARGSGNRSTLMTSYYDLGTEFISDPVPIDDDGTADFDPYLYAAQNGSTYVIWKNAQKPITADMTFAEIAASTELAVAEHEAGNAWYSSEQITDFAGTGKFAAAARISVTPEGEPVAAYYTNSVDDPLGLGGTHEVYLARRKDGRWTSEKITEVTGMVSSVDLAKFGLDVGVVVSYETDTAASCALWSGGKKVWEKKDASSGAFLGAGYNSVRLTWYQNGQIFQLTPEGKESALTPDTITIPAGNYELFGRIGSSPLMIVGTALKDTCENAYAYISRDGGTTWGRADLTHVEKKSSVSHISAAFTYDQEPILLYSVQNYNVNTDLDRLMEDPASVEADDLRTAAGPLQLGDDARFTDTQTDLYIKARLLNRHAALDEGTALNTETAMPGRSLPFTLTVRNTGLYPIEHAAILYEGEIAGEFTGSLNPGETATVQANAVIPKNARPDLYMNFEISTRDDLEPEGSVSVFVHPGYMEASTEHIFARNQESITYRIINHGYAAKTARIVVRDEFNDIDIYEGTASLGAGDIYDGSYDAENSVFSNSGYDNVTLYVLFDDEEPGDPSISVNRVNSIMPLPPIYSQSMAPLE